MLKSNSAMAPSPSTLFSFIFILIISTATAATITIPLSPYSSPSAAPPLHEILSHLASTSLSRALKLKHSSPPPSSSSSSPSSLVTTPLFPRSYGGYSISLSFGTPPQTTKFVMDTGSTLVWFPCTSRYLCSRCNFRNVDPTNITTFIPKKSSTAKLIGCKNPKCQWIYGPNVAKTCSGCDSGAKSGPNCTQTCPPYSIQYGSGATAGLLISETLDLSADKTVPDFLVGCSFLSIRQPEGIAGFGRGLDSLPYQVGAKSFSYCLVSHRFDETSVSSDLVLDLDSDKKTNKKTTGLSYTPFQKNPDSSNSAFQTYYYLMLRQILVGGKRVKVPYKYLEPSKSDGNGGTIVDSGTTFSYMEGPVYEAVAAAIVKEMSSFNYTVAKDIQDLAGLRPCFDVSSQDKLRFPQLSFKFKGGAKMELPATNYFVLVTEKVICFTIVSDSVVGKGGGGGGGPAIILGNYQQRDYNIEYDLENERFGFKRQKCA